MVPITFDNIIFSLQKCGGISHYWANLCQEIDIQYYLEYPNSSLNLSRREIDIPNEQIIYRDQPARCSLYFERPATIGDTYIFHSSYYRVDENSKNVLTVHDTIYENCRKGLPKEIHVRLKKHAIERADFIIFVSENTKVDFNKHYGFPRAKTCVIYNGISDKFKPLKTIDTLFLKKIIGTNFPEKWFLFVGKRDYYKNFSYALEMVSQMKNFGLICIGGAKLTKKEEKLSKSMLCGRIRHLFPTQEELNILYNSAFALLYPTSYEGFGFPVVEAIRVGCPVICQKIQVLEEILGDAGIFLNDLTINCFKKSVDLIESKGIEEMIQKGFLRAERYSIAAMVKQYEDVYSSLQT